MSKLPPMLFCSLLHAMSSANLQCPLCDTDRLKVLKSHAKCLNCNLHFKLNKDLIDSDDEKKRYSLHNNSLEDEGYLNYLAKLLDLIPELRSPVLDFGCGPTKGLEALFKKRGLNTKVESYDPYFYENDLSNKVFKTVYASECFEHFNNPKKTISKIKRLMDVDAVLAIRTELYNSDLGPIEKWWYFKDPTHVCFYTNKTFEWIAEEFNLTPIFIKSPHLVFKSSF